DHDPDSGDNNNTDDENPNSMDIDSDAEETLLFESNENNDYSSAIKKRAKEFMKLYSQLARAFVEKTLAGRSAHAVMLVVLDLVMLVVLVALGLVMPGHHVRCAWS
ncbi:4419_t:CDS:2, partial [Entrophospora sp. SA101]